MATKKLGWDGLVELGVKAAIADNPREAFRDVAEGLRSRQASIDAENDPAQAGCIDVCAAPPDGILCEPCSEGAHAFCGGGTCECLRNGASG